VTEMKPIREFISF